MNAKCTQWRFLCLWFEYRRYGLIVLPCLEIGTPLDWYEVWLSFRVHWLKWSVSLRLDIKRPSLPSKQSLWCYLSKWRPDKAEVLWYKGALGALEKQAERLHKQQDQNVFFN